MDPDLVRQQEEAELASRRGASAPVRQAEAAQVFQAARPSHDQGAAPLQDATPLAHALGEQAKTEAPSSPNSDSMGRHGFSPACTFTGGLAGFAAGGIAGAALDLPIPQILLLAGALAILFGALTLTMFNRRPEARS
jgi:hypothetical protein